jgi:riboflavin synthase
MAETLRVTNLKSLQPEDKVHIERSAKFGDEIGGHVLSGHVDTTVKIVSIEKIDTWQWVMTFHVAEPWLDYIFPKGFVALDGASLTVVDVNRAKNIFTVHLIPETLKRSNFSHRKEGDEINLEVDQTTKTIVETIKRLKPQNC